MLKALSPRCYYSPDSEIGFVLWVCGEHSEAEALDLSEDVVAAPCPFERLGIGGCRVDIGGDGGFEIGRGLELAASDRGSVMSAKSAR